MRCPRCETIAKHMATKQTDHTVIRRYNCEFCKMSFKTYEAITVAGYDKVDEMAHRTNCNITLIMERCKKKHDTLEGYFEEVNKNG